MRIIPGLVQIAARLNNTIAIGFSKVAHCAVFNNRMKNSGNNVQPILERVKHCKHTKGIHTGIKPFFSKQSLLDQQNKLHFT